MQSLLRPAVDSFVWISVFLVKQFFLPTIYTHTQNGKVWAKSNAIFYNDFAKVFFADFGLKLHWQVYL